MDGVDPFDGVAQFLRGTQAVMDGDSPNDQNVSVQLDFPHGFCTQLTARGINLARLQRASKGSRQSTRCGRNDVVQRGRARCRQADIETLRKAGWSDRAILDATLIASYFSFVNRIALTLGVELEGRFVHEASQR
jgi:hypothetical protein